MNAYFPQRRGMSETASVAVQKESVAEDVTAEEEVLV
jgi:hypothetical protein